MGRTSDARQRLMDAAYALIWEHSYGAITIDAICERAAVKKGSFYYFFDSKSDLAGAAVDAWWVERQVIMEKLFSPGIPPVQSLRSFFDFVAERQLKEYEKNGQVLGCPLLTLGAEICTQDEKIRARIQIILNAYLAFWTNALAEAQRRGEIKLGHAASKARCLMSFYEGALTLARIENNPETLRTLSADAMEMIGAETSPLVEGLSELVEHV